MSKLKKKKTGGEKHKCIDYNDPTILLLIGIVLILYFYYAKYICPY